MTHFADTHPTTIALARSSRIQLLAGLAALASIVIVIALVQPFGNDNGAGSLPSQTLSTGFAGGPSADTPSAVSRAFGTEGMRPGGLALTTNVPAAPRYDAGPSSGTASAVSSALTPRVEVGHSVEAGPRPGTPTAVREATSTR
jgi:hypothetical protein